MTRDRIFCIIPLSLILLLLPLTPVGSADRRTALVIGNATYEHNPLLNPVNDARDMAEALRQVGFQVALLLDANLRTMIEALNTFSRDLRQGGVGLFYFAGHGIQVGGENYLLPLRTNINREQDVPYEAVPVGRILGGMQDADNQLNVIILDACRNNPFARQWRASQGGLAVVQAVQGSLIAYATAPGSVALDGSGRNGLYTSFLLQHLSTSGLSVEHLFKRVRSDVVRATKGAQIPWESSSLIGDFSFVSQTPEVPPRVGVSESSPPSMSISSVPSSPDPEATMWALVERSNHPDDLTEFLTFYPNGRFAPVARLKLRQLQRLATQQHEEKQTRPAKQEREREETEARQPAQVIYGQDGKEMRLVPAGWFEMGSTDAEAEAAYQLAKPFYKDAQMSRFEDEQPQHRLWIDGFYMDTYEVTMEEYRAFQRATKYRELPEGVSTYAPGNQHPVVGVSWDDAKAYCRWAEKQLPTEAQWEKAARGLDGQTYPWGNYPVNGRWANYCDATCDEYWNDAKQTDGYPYTAPVGSFPDGKSPYGIHDLAGNVWEWVRDGYDATYYSRSPERNPVNTTLGEGRVLRGGGWNSLAAYVRAAYRFWSAPDYLNTNIGIRCVVEVPGPRK